jgi:hypothetical protein
VLIRVLLRRMLVVFDGMQVMTIGHFGVVCGFLVISSFVVFRGFPMMLSRMIMMVRGLLMVLVYFVTIHFSHPVGCNVSNLTSP